MMKQSYLTGEIEGQGYDERVKLYYGNDVQKTLLFDYWTYRFFNNKEDELWVSLNFGKDKFIPHAVKKLGNQIVFIPRFLDPELYYQANGLVGLTWREYLEKIAPEIFIFPQQNWTDIWLSLNISLEGLLDITEATSEDIFLLWLISSNFHPPNSLVAFIPEYVEALASNILAEHPEHYPSVKDVLQMFLNEKISLSVALVGIATNDFMVTAYLLDKSESTRDWIALFFNENNQTGLVLAGLGIKLTIHNNIPTG